ncbi:MAG: sigma-70 family RNA polymerase sigma factor, partial [Gemmataceae bacterium]|nr:sigma-70 family RNA polymerase sigma factor [Gemmataceae bacterium]
MDATPVSLLESLRRPDPGPAWDRFVLLYTDLLFTWAHRLGAAGPDADDLVQDVFAVLVRELPAFRYSSGGRFRGWLWTVVRNKARERARRPAVPVAAGGLSDVAGP